MLSEATPANTTFVSLASPAGWTCSNPPAGGTGAVDCTNPSVAVGSDVFTMTVAVPFDAGGETIVNSATVSATNDSTSDNNTATVSTSVPRHESVCSGVPQSTCSDRALADVHAPNVDCITAYGFAEGFTDGTYRPQAPVSRAQMASFVARLVARAGVTLPATPPDAFPGDHGDVHELAINQLAAAGILDATTGQSGTAYRVGEPVRRDDTAQILSNSFRVIRGSNPLAGPDAFSDDTNGGDPLGTGTDDEAAINSLAAADVVRGTAPGTYSPTSSVSRAQFASFFARFAQLIVDHGGSSLAPDQRRGLRSGPASALRAAPGIIAGCA